MPAQLSRGQTFVDGGTGNATMLHALVDDGLILPGAISEQAQVAPADGDNFLLWRPQSGLKRTSLLQIKNSIPSGAAGSIASLRKLGIRNNEAAAGNDIRLRNEVNGVRFGMGTAIDRAATPADFRWPAVSLQPGTNTVIDWDLADTFYDALLGNKTYTFNHVRNLSRQRTLIT